VDERRRAERVPISTSFSESDPRTTTPVANLSRTGALVSEAPLLPVGARIELRFVVFPDDPLLFVHTGRVVRHLHRPAGMGVEFDPMPPAVDALLSEILERAAALAGSSRRRRQRLILDAHQLRTRRFEGD
jgi:PilZ domain